MRRSGPAICTRLPPTGETMHAGDDGGVEALLGLGSRGDRERHRQRQRDDADDDAGDDVAQPMRATQQARRDVPREERSLRAPHSAAKYAKARLACKNFCDGTRSTLLRCAHEEEPCQTARDRPGARFHGGSAATRSAPTAISSTHTKSRSAARNAMDRVAPTAWRGWNAASSASSASPAREETEEASHG